MTAARSAYLATLHRLAALRGVQTSYIDAAGNKQHASSETLARILAALGSDAGTEAQAAASERKAIEESRRRRIEPVTIVWSGGKRRAAFSLAGATRGCIRWSIALETGEVLEGSSDAARGASFSLPESIPEGVHRLRVAHSAEYMESTLIVAPRHAYRDPGGARKQWGIFCPVYALRSKRRAPIGDLTELGALARWASIFGARMVATLPLLACYLGDRPGPCDPSPYAPISRLFWNELFIDPAGTPEFSGCAAARRLVASESYRRASARLARGALVEYRAAAILKRPVIEALARLFFDSGGERSASFRAFLAEKPLAREYALFRSVTERRGEAWTEWPESQRRRTRPGDGDPDSTRYHLYAQFAVWRELLALGGEMKSMNAALYLDLPVGVSGRGFDTWKYPGLFAPCATGAPPDPYFTSGQNWGFPPMHPEACREDGYAYLRACLASHMRHAEVLRLDHVMAFHRLYWIPEGMSARDGAYVRYHAEELHALLNIESHRQRCSLVGENLGTVPAEVERAITRHRLSGLYVAQNEMRPSPPALRPPPARSVASLNTHDMPPFAAMWAGTDIDLRIKLKMLDAKRRGREHADRRKAKQALVAFLRQRGLLAGSRASVAGVRDALLRHLSRGPAERLLINLEDLWSETKWQNVPGTTSEHPNWRRKLKLTLEECAADPRIARLLRDINAHRSGSATQQRRTQRAPTRPRRAAR